MPTAADIVHYERSRLVQPCVKLWGDQKRSCDDLLCWMDLI